LTGAGYGIVSFQKELQLVHRLIYEFAKGPIPKGMYVCHKCDQPACMNINHLFLGTPADNNQDCIDKGRKPHGSDTGASKLTEGQVIEIRGLIEDGVSQSKIAKEYGVDQSLVCLINTKKRWGWLR